MICCLDFLSAHTSTSKPKPQGLTRQGAVSLRWPWLKVPSSLQLTTHSSQLEHRGGCEEDATDQWCYKSKVQLWEVGGAGAGCRGRLEKKETKGQGIDWIGQQLAQVEGPHAHGSGSNAAYGPLLHVVPSFTPSFPVYIHYPI